MRFWRLNHTYQWVKSRTISQFLLSSDALLMAQCESGGGRGMNSQSIFVQEKVGQSKSYHHSDGAMNFQYPIFTLWHISQVFFVATQYAI